MTIETVNIKDRSLRFWTYLARFFMSLSLGFSIYISSSFLAQFLDESYVGMVFAVAALISIIILFRLPAFLAEYGNVRLMATLGLISILIIPLMVTVKSVPMIVSLFILYSVLSLLIRYGLDLYLEHLSKNEITGEVRGIFTALTHGPLLFAVISTSFLLGQTGDYWKVFAGAAIALLPFVIIAGTRLTEDKNKYRHQPVFDALKNIILAQDDYDKKLHQILAIDFLINFFYVVMVIYTPVYLLNHIGFVWSDISLMFALMTLPFIVLPIPLGWLADRKIGEKELLSAGLLITGLATLAMSFTNSSSFWLWVSLLTLTRVGAATVESMKEAYLFKIITSGDIGILSISRNTVSLAHIIAPFMISVFLSLFDFKFLFAFLGLVMLFGLRHSLILIDTK